MSDEEITVAPERAEMQRDGDEMQTDTHTHRGSPSHGGCTYCESIANNVCGHIGCISSYLVNDLGNDLSSGETYHRCLLSCVALFFCHAFANVFLNICFCCRCLTCLVALPEYAEPKTPVEKFFAFFARILSNLWVLGLLALVARCILFRPYSMVPHLGVSTVHEFELLQPSSATVTTTDPPHIRFNVTTYLLFRNEHKVYNMRYNHLAVSVLYADEKIAPVDGELPSFKQKPHQSTVVRLVFAGQLRNPSTAVSQRFAGDKDQGMLEMVVRIRLTQSYKFWPFKPEYFIIYDCPLSSPFPRAGKPSASHSAWCKTYFTA
ncbi:hypothetical protein BS78_K178600 [Paspalum vaginatum]|uniref:Late embryogenesis abundant protein LEA-2 subgroup domain-containing protein n=1 Tax=Paspalum vaginatum TaxID=158149 RepID=A0A9W7XAN9_9POAL|nr:hypothetical protein BS78_K178600 [Paspalum vaginatum]